MTGNLKLDKMLVLVFMLLSLGGAGLVIYSHTMIEKKRTDEIDEFRQMKSDAQSTTEVTAVKMKKLTINLYSRKSRLRFLDVELNIVPFAEEQKSTIKDSEPLIADSVITVAGNMSPSELNSTTGKILLESRIRKRVNHALNGQIIRKIFFSVYVVQ